MYAVSYLFAATYARLRYLVGIGLYWFRLVECPDCREGEDQLLFERYWVCNRCKTIIVRNGP